MATASPAVHPPCELHLTHNYRLTQETHATSQQIDTLHPYQKSHLCFMLSPGRVLDHSCCPLARSLTIHVHAQHSLYKIPTVIFITNVHSSVFTSPAITFNSHRCRDDGHKVHQVSFLVVSHATNCLYERSPECHIPCGVDKGEWQPSYGRYSTHISLQ